MKWLAYHDSLTGLKNRNWLYENIDKIDSRYIYFIDINGLRGVNILGHAVGDEFIREAIRSIHLHEKDILIRYAGDEFILFSDLENAITTNRLFCVGSSEFVSGALAGIISADLDMMKEKQTYYNGNVQ